jgi:hypothetical protein
MADCKQNPFEGPTCSIAEAILWVAYRDAARIRDAPSLFSLEKWPDEITKALWRLLHALAREQRTIDALSTRPGRLIGPEDYRHAYSTLKAAEAEIGHTVTLPFGEIRSVTRTSRDFIVKVESVLAFIEIDTDSLTQTFPVPNSRPAPADPESPVSESAPELAPLEPTLPDDRIGNIARKLRSCIQKGAGEWSGRCGTTSRTRAV